MANLVSQKEKNNFADKKIRSQFMIMYMYSLDMLTNVERRERQRKRK